MDNAFIKNLYVSSFRSVSKQSACDNADKHLNKTDSRCKLIFEKKVQENFKKIHANWLISAVHIPNFLEATKSPLTKIHPFLSHFRKGRSWWVFFLFASLQHFLNGVLIYTSYLEATLEPCRATLMLLLTASPLRFPYEALHGTRYLVNALCRCRKTFRFLLMWKLQHYTT